MTAKSTLLKNIRPWGGDATDMLITDGRITKIMANQVPPPDCDIHDGEGAIVLPGLVEAHTHLDKTLWGMGWRPHQAGPSLQDKIDTERRLRRDWNIEPHRQSMRQALLSISKGTTAIRSHVDLDTECGMAGFEGASRKRAALAGQVDIEIVAFPQSGLLNRPGTLELMDQALREGADVVGGLDPCSMDRDPKGHLDAVFALAERYGKPIDIHLHEPDALGAFSIELILERVLALGMQGRVTISHAFCLGMPDRDRARALIAELAAARVHIATVALPHRPVPAASELREAGVTLCAGSDGIRDTWGPYGNADMLERAIHLGLRNNLRTDEDVEYALRCCTYNGAAVMGLVDYGLASGDAADLVLVAAESLAHAVVAHPVRKLVMKGGEVVARDGRSLTDPPMSRPRAAGRVLMTGKYVVGHADGHHVLLPDGEVVFENGQIIFVGRGFEGEVAERIACGNALIGPGFIDLDALGDLDTTVLALDNQPGWKKGRVWPESYMRAGPREMYSAEDLRWQKRYAFTRLISNGITTALPISSLFYREWSETWDEFAGAAEAAEELGLRVYLGPAYRSGNTFVTDAGAIAFHFDEDRGLAGLAEAEHFAAVFEGRGDGLIRTMLAPDRIETCTARLLRRSADVARDLNVPIRLHCCQSGFEYESVVRRHGKSPPEWLQALGFLSPRTILPHLTHISGCNGITYEAPDLDILAGSGASLAHCPLVMARGGAALHAFGRYRDAGLTIGMGTDTHPPDMILNMQVGLLAARMVENDPLAVSAADMYDAATLGGARALGRSDLGRLAPGMRADITVIRLDDPATGQVIDPVQTVILNGSGRDVCTVVIDGRIVMRDRVIPGVDSDLMRARAQRQFDGLVARYPERTLDHPPVESIFTPSYPLR